MQYDTMQYNIRLIMRDVEVMMKWNKAQKCNKSCL